MMMRRLAVSTFVLLTLVFNARGLTAEPSGSGLISPAAANRFGLERAWFTQLRLTPGGRGIVDVRLHVSSTKAQTLFRVFSRQSLVRTFSDRSLDAFGRPLGEEGARKAAEEQVRMLQAQGMEARVENAVVPDIILYATSGNGLIHSIDAETGRPLWSTSVGETRFPTTPAAVTETHVGVINGQTLFILAAEDGAILETKRIVGVPGAGPLLIDNLAFVPLLNGNIKAFAFGPEAPWWPTVYRSRGRVMIQPTAAGNYLVWANNMGDISVVAAGEQGVRFRLRLTDAIAGPIIYVPPKQILGVTDAGNLYSFDVSTGQLMWRFACGDPTAQPAAIVGDLVFLMTRDRGMHVVSAETGLRIWPAAFEPARTFAAATTDRVYCTTNRGDLVALDAATGRQVSRIPLNLTDRLFTNNQTDRIYVSTRHGALQCLHEMGADLPTVHLPEEPREAPPAEDGQSPAPDAAQGVDPFSTEATDADAAADMEQEEATEESGNPFE